MKNVLVFPCGSEIALEINNALKYSKDFELFGASSVDDHGMYVYKNYIPNVPFIDDENFLSYLNAIIEEYGIDFIYPAHDDVIFRLSQLENQINATVVGSDERTCEIARHKSKTYELFKDEEFCPKTYDVKVEDFDSVEGIEKVEKLTENEFPIFLKPDAGQGAKGVVCVEDMDGLKHSFKENPDLIAVEYLPKKEYTIDCFTSDGELVYCEMRERIRVKDGISVNAITIETDDEIYSIALKINSKLSFRGAWFFQLKKDYSNQYKLLEIAPRIAGTMALHRNAGVNFQLLSLYVHMGIDVSIILNKNKLTIDRALTNRFNWDMDYERVYVDFDDTIFFKGKINTYLMMFLYQCVNENKQIILITKHINDIRSSLDDLKIHESLFDEIITLTKDDDKFNYIDDEVPSIFIDDSFSERLDISKRFDIPVFDLDAVESLIDWRM